LRPGAVLLSAALRRPEVRFTGLEMDPAALALATENIALNDLNGRVQVQSADVGKPFARLNLLPFDAALANPPFFDDPGALRAPKPENRRHG